MWTELTNTTPTEWLLSIKLPPFREHRSPAARVPEILGTFDPSAKLRVVRFGAPHTFMRFHPKGSISYIFEPGYWADGIVLAESWGHAAQFEGWLTTAEVARIAKAHYRDRTAVSYCWNKFDSDTLWRINLEGSESVEGLMGPTRAQPTHQATTTERASTSMLRGGGMQFYLYPRTPFICQPVDWR